MRKTLTFIIIAFLVGDVYAWYGTSPYAYCAGDPVNFIDPNGMAVVADSASQFAILNSLPEAERPLVHFDNDGLLSIDVTESQSEVLADLMKLHLSNTTYNLHVSPSDMNGVPFRNNPSNYYKGYTQTPMDPDYPSQDGNVHIYLSSLLQGIDLLLTYGHETLAHALLYEMDVPYGHDYKFEPVPVINEKDIWITKYKELKKTQPLIRKSREFSPLLLEIT